jgi:adenosylcobinamide kinase/adenosylcobinamide-phosphate guanylyltransferase
MANPLTLVLGGARSGKSRHAEALIQAASPPWTYIATAESYDAEMSARIAEHRARRPEGWVTVDAPRDLPEAVACAPDAPLLVDCLTLWLSNLMLAEADLEPASEALITALLARAAPTGGRGRASPREDAEAQGGAGCGGRGPRPSRRAC